MVAGKWVVAFSMICQLIVSPKLHAVLNLFFGDSECSREIEIRSKHMGMSSATCSLFNKEQNPKTQLRAGLVLRVWKSCLAGGGICG